MTKKHVKILFFSGQNKGEGGLIKHQTFSGSFFGPHPNLKAFIDVLAVAKKVCGAQNCS